MMDVSEQWKTHVDVKASACCAVTGCFTWVPLLCKAKRAKSSSCGFGVEGGRQAAKRCPSGRSLGQTENKFGVELGTRRA